MKNVEGKKYGQKSKIQTENSWFGNKSYQSQNYPSKDKFEFASSIQNSKLSKQSGEQDSMKFNMQKTLSKTNFEKSAPNLQNVDGSDVVNNAKIFKTHKYQTEITDSEQVEIDLDSLNFTKSSKNKNKIVEKSDSLLKPIFNQAKRNNFKKEMESIRKADKQTRKARRDISVSSRTKFENSQMGSSRQRTSSKSKRLKGRTNLGVKTKYLNSQKFQNKKTKGERRASRSSKQSKTSRQSTSKGKYRIKAQFGQKQNSQEYSVQSSRSYNRKMNDSNSNEGTQGGYSSKLTKKVNFANNSERLPKSRSPKTNSEKVSLVSQQKKKSKIPRFKKLYYMDNLISELKNTDSKDSLELAENGNIADNQSKNDFKTSVKNKHGKKGKAFYEHFLQSVQSVVYMENTPKPSEDDILGKKVYLPPKREGIKKTVIFDLDETLIHCNDNPSNPCDIKVPIKFTGGDIIQAGLIIRPYAKEILELMSQHYEVVVFTASHACYANIVLNILDPQNKFISYRLFREHCIKTKEGIFIKDLRVISNRKLKDMVIIDNAFYSYGFQMFNGIPIIPFYDNKLDTELKQLSKFLVKIKDVEDMRTAIKAYFFVHLFKKYCSKQEVLAKMIVKARDKM